MHGSDWKIPDGYRKLEDHEVVLKDDLLMVSRSETTNSGGYAGQTAKECNSSGGVKTVDYPFIRKIEEPAPEKEWLNAWE